MPAITIFSGVYCKQDQIIRDIIASTGYRRVTDKDIVAGAGRRSGIPEDKIYRTFSSRTSIFNKFTHEKEGAIAYLKLALGEILADDNILVEGFSSHLIPAAVSHALRVCLIADLKFRLAVAAEEEGLGEKGAAKIIRSRDEDCAAWVAHLHSRSDPWDADLYDVVIPMNKISVEQAAVLIQENVLKDVVRTTEKSRQAVADFLLAAEVEVALAGEGHNVDIEAEGGRITLIINKHVLMLSRLEEELKSIAGRVPGVASIETTVGKDYHRSNIYRKHDFEVPSRVLLVDDEREFIQTLSERLLLRDMGSAVAYDGESALDLVREDEPEVMIIDLKMPGIDGMEVLKKVKQTSPDIEVIVLTGHGSDVDRDKCMELGAFAYLQKPVDIDRLSEMLKQAHEKIRRKKEAHSS